MAMSILKGLDYEEALYLGAVLASLAPARRFFHRRSTLTQLDFGRSWVAAISLVLGASAYLVFFSYRHVMFAEEVWWRVSLDAAASRSLRATLCAAVAAGIIGLIRMMRPVQPRLSLPDAEQLSHAASIAAASPVASAHLALLGDKSLLFSTDGTAFLMYAICGRTWVAMGDPVGSPAGCAEVAWRFRELAGEHDARTVFYLVSPDNLSLYVDLGLSLRKLGESAHIPLTEFSLEGGTRKWMRRARKAATTAGCTFEIVSASNVSPILPELERISNAWLAAKRTREKGFSLGFFDKKYLARLPVAVVRCKGEIVAFANLWPSGEHEELSVDLMRYSPSAPPGVSDYLLCELMLWGRNAGYRQFDLGMAPLSGLEPRRHAPFWNLVGSLVYKRGEPFYHFQGLRRFKDKFEPEWEPRYLATSGPSTVPAALGGVTTLVSRGLAGVIRR
jgi:phosphatidylglycerol lysyltransferase